MKKINTLIFCLFLGGLIANAQSVFGKWKTIDDETGKAKSYVEIYQKDGKAYGKILELLEPSKKGAKCTACKGSNKNQPIEGMVILKGLGKDGSEWNGGTILDPASGKEYKCYIELESENKLKVRGFVGFSLLGRTQYWYRVDK